MSYIISNVHIYNNKIIKIPIDKSECHNVYMRRSAFIIRRLINDVEYDEACRLSYIWRNIKIYNMKYPASIHDSIDELCDKQID